MPPDRIHLSRETSPITRPRIAPARRPAVFLDASDALADVLLPASARAAIRTLRAAGYALVVVTDQPDVARGLFPIEALGRVRARLEEQLGAPLDGFYVCPHHPDGSVPAFATDCICRKPLPGMLTRAARDLRLDLARSWTLGDHPRHLEAGARAGCRTALLAPDDAARSRRAPTIVAADLTDAIHRILRARGAPRSSRTISSPSRRERA